MRDLNEFVKNYESGDKAKRIQADAQLRKQSSSFELSYLHDILISPTSSIHQKMASSFAIGYHKDSNINELKLLFDVLQNAKGDPNTYTYRILAAIRKILSKGIRFNGIEDYVEILNYYKIAGGKDLKGAAQCVIAELIPKNKNIDMIVNPIFRYRNFDLDINQAFILMPFSEDWSNRIWKKIIKPTVEESGIKAIRADDLYGYDIIEDIWHGINSSLFVIADITGRNPNVFYELGISHTIGKPVILLTQNANDIPVDLNRYRHIIYQDNYDGYETLTVSLKRTIQEIVRVKDINLLL